MRIIRWRLSTARHWIYSSQSLPSVLSTIHYHHHHSHDHIVFAIMVIIIIIIIIIVVVVVNIASNFVNRISYQVITTWTPVFKFSTLKSILLFNIIKIITILLFNIIKIITILLFNIIKINTILLFNIIKINTIIKQCLIIDTTVSLQTHRKSFWKFLSIFSNFTR